MNKKWLLIWYWCFTISFALFLLGDGIASLLHDPTGAVIIASLGYPAYIMTILGVAKILAAVAIVQTKFRTIKEWAFAGYTIDCLGAAASHYFAHSGTFEIVLSFVFLAIMFFVYWLWKEALPVL